MDSSGWSNGIRYHAFGTRPDTEFELTLIESQGTPRPHSVPLHINLLILNVL